MALPVPAQLPADLPTFTGRVAELERLVADWVTDRGAPPTVVITAIEGMAGIGKTALAVRAAHRLAHRFADGQLFLDLHGFSDRVAPVRPSQALDRMLRALGVPGQQVPADLDARAALLRSTLASRRVLLVLDNAADEAQVRSLLPGAAGCLVLITSRRRLAGLEGAQPLSIDVLPPTDAAAMFTRIAGPGHPADLVAEVVELCGRLPLAIRLAAARLRDRPSWTAGYLAERLRAGRDRLDELDAGAAGVTAAIDLSYRQLTADQRHTFRLLGLHPWYDIDGYAAAAATDLPPRRAGRLLDDLMEAHLLQEAAPGRYQIHDLVRAFATRVGSAELAAADARAAVTRLLDYHLATAATAADVLYPAERSRRPRVAAPGRELPALPDQAAAGAWLDREHANLLALAAHAAEHGWPTHVSHLSQTLARHLQTRAQITDAETLHRHAEAASRQAADKPGQAYALSHLATICGHLGRHHEARAQLSEAAALHRETGSRAGEARAANNLGVAHAALGDYPAAIVEHERALALFRCTGDRSGEATALVNLGIVAGSLGRHGQAIDHFRPALDIYRSVGNRQGEVSAVCNLGVSYQLSGQYQDAADQHQEALAIARASANLFGEAMALDGLGSAIAGLGRYDVAIEHHRQARALLRGTGVRTGLAEVCNNFARTLRQAGRPAEAVDLHQEALALAGGGSDDRRRQADAYDGLGRAEYDLGRLEAARRHWRQALDILVDLGAVDADRIRRRLAGPGEEVAGPDGG
jgi:tetratricopeptide (TPR) repeat protein